MHAYEDRYLQQEEEGSYGPHYPCPFCERRPTTSLRGCLHPLFVPKFLTCLPLFPFSRGPNFPAACKASPRGGAISTSHVHPCCSEREQRNPDANDLCTTGGSGSPGISVVYTKSTRASSRCPPQVGHASRVTLTSTGGVVIASDGGGSW